MILAAVVVVLGILAWAIIDYAATHKLRKELDRVVAAGEPLTFKQMRESAGVPEPSGSAGRYYSAALELLVDKSVSELLDELNRQASVQGPKLDAALSGRIEEALRVNEETLRLADHAAALPMGGLDSGLEFGMRACMNRMGRIRALSRLLSLRSRYLAVMGRGDEAGRSVMAALKAAGSLDQQQVLIVYLVRLALISLVCSDVQFVVEQSLPSSSVLMEWQKALEEFELGLNLEKVVRAERVYTLGVTTRVMPKDMRAFLAEGNGDVTMEVQWPPTPLLRYAVALYLRNLARVADAVRQPWPDVWESVRIIEQEKPGFMQGGLMPPMTRAVGPTGAGVAKCRCVRIALMIESYRREKGNLPQSLQELVPQFGQEIPADPFSGRDLLYRVQPEAFVVYSVFEDGRDDGGEIQKKENNREKDCGLAFRLSGGK
jgi:hypothetical protein